MGQCLSVNVYLVAVLSIVQGIIVDVREPLAFALKELLTELEEVKLAQE